MKVSFISYGVFTAMCALTGLCQKIAMAGPGPISAGPSASSYINMDELTNSKGWTEGVRSLKDGLREYVH